MAFRKGVHITRGFILDRVREEDIFNRYFGPVIYDRDICNYARLDEHPGCRFYTHKITGRIRFKDYGRGHNWDCFEAATQRVGPTYNLEFRALLNYIAKDFGLINSKVSDKRIAEIRESFQERIDTANNLLKKGIKLDGLTTKLSWEGRKYWSQYEIAEVDTKDFYVYEYDKAHIINFYADGSTTERSLITTKNELKFAYYLGEEEWKLYFPNRKKGNTRFIQTRADILQGWYLLPKFGKSVVITKAYKDVIALWKLGKIPAIAPQSENILMGTKVMRDLERRFDDVYILFDNDRAGLKATVQNVDRYDYLKSITFAKGYPKDVTDAIKKFGLNRVRNTLLPLFG
jgi:hypothetical protein